MVARSSRASERAALARSKGPSSITRMSPCKAGTHSGGSLGRSRARDQRSRARAVMGSQARDGTGLRALSHDVARGSRRLHQQPPGKIRDQRSLCRRPHAYADRQSPARSPCPLRHRDLRHPQGRGRKLRRGRKGASGGTARLSVYSGRRAPWPVGRSGSGPKADSLLAGNGALWNIVQSRLPISVELDARELHHLAPLLGFVGDELAEVGGRAHKHHTAQVGEARF